MREDSRASVFWCLRSPKVQPGDACASAVLRRCSRCETGPKQQKNLNHNDCAGSYYMLNRKDMRATGLIAGPPHNGKRGVLARRRFVLPSAKRNNRTDLKE